jgi:deoxyribose-phosphate aldolase
MYPIWFINRYRVWVQMLFLCATMKPIHNYIDHTLLKPTATLADVEQCCREALEYEFAAVCIPPLYVKKARAILGDKVKTGTVIGFPFGYNAIESKLAECILAIVDGADELDFVVNISALKNGDWRFLAEEIRHIFPVVKSKDKILKVIIETGVLKEDEIIKCCELYGVAGADFLKTSTGYAAVGATVEAVQLMRNHLPSNVQIKASGGIRSYDFARQLIEAGATRLGCSASVEIVKQSPKL